MLVSPSVPINEAETIEFGERPVEKRGRPRAEETKKKREMVLKRHKKILEMGQRHARTREYLEDDELGPFFLGRGPAALRLLRSVYEVPDPYAYCKPLVIYIHGPTEVHKSREARRWLRDVCRLPPHEVWIWMPSKDYKWHPKYERHKAILLDDFVGGMPQAKLRNVLDGYEIPFEEKNGDIVHCPKIIIITSDRSYDQLELKGHDKNGEVIPMTSAEKSQIRRRINHVYHFTVNALEFPNVIPLARPAVLGDLPLEPPEQAENPLDLLAGSPSVEDGDLGRLRAQLGLSGEGWEELDLDRAGEGLDGERWEQGGWDLIEA